MLAQALGMGLVLATLGLLFAVLATRQLVAEVDRGLLDVAGELGALATQGDAAALVEDVRRRTAKSSPDTTLVALREDGAVVAGNVRAWPVELATVPSWARVEAAVPAPGPPVSSVAAAAVDVRALRVLLGPDRELFVGRPTSREALAGTPIVALAVGMLLLTGVLAVLGALLIGRRLVLPLARMNGALGAIGGDASGRLPTGARDDEFAALAAAINAMLDRIEGLLTDQRRVHETIAHDLRHPLARARTELLEEEGEADEAARTRALVAIDEALRAFDALLDLRTLGGDGVRAGFEPLDLTVLATDVEEFYGPLLEEQGMTARIEASGTVAVAGDADLLFRVLANLVENAVQHGSAAELVLRVETCSTGPVLTLEEAGTRTTPVAPGAHRGHGLGLALADRILEVHGGRIAVEAGGNRRTRLLFPPLPEAEDSAR